MAPKKVVDADFLLIDLNSNDMKSLEYCLYKYITRKTSSETSATASKCQDVYKFALIGSDTGNALDYKHIKTINDWEYYDLNDLAKMSSLIKGYTNTQQANIFEGLYLAAHHLENDFVVATHAFKRIILFSDLNSEPFSNSQQIVGNVQKFLKNSDIWLYAVGPHVKIPLLRNYEDIENWAHSVVPADSSNSNQKTNLKMMKNVLNNGIIADFDVGLDMIFYYKPELKPPYPWYSELRIGDIEMKINVVKLVHDAPGFIFPEKGKEKKEYDTEGEAKYATQMKNPDTGEIVLETSDAYRIHGRLVVVSAEKEKMAIERGEMNEDKCFEIKYFINKDVISPLYFGEESLSTIVADTRETEEWESPLEILTEAMHKLNVAAIVKRIHASGPQFRPKPFVMFVCPEHGSLCLLLASWPEAEEICLNNAYVKGPKVEPKFENIKLKNAFDNYLSSITIDNDDYIDDGKIIHCLAPHLKQNSVTMSQCEHFIRTHLEPDYEFNKYNLDSIKEYNRHPILEERSKTPWEELKKLLPKKKKNQKRTTK